MCEFGGRIASFQGGMNKVFDKIKGKIIIKLKKVLGLEAETVEMLRNRGVIVGNNVSCFGKIDNGHGFLVTIGDDVTISTATILTHDASTKCWLGYSRIGRVTIGSRVFIGAGAIVLPNVTIGDDVIIGAGSVVTRNIPSNSVAVGNPARVICTLEDYINREKEKLQNSYVGNKYWRDMSKEDIIKMQKDILEGMCAYDL